MSEVFRAEFQVAWGDLDTNGHMANAAFLDYATQARFLFFSANGFEPADFRRHGVGPVIATDRIRYRRELLFLERFEVDYFVGAIAEDGARFTIRNRFFRGDELCAEIETDGAWFDLKERRVVPPPAELDAVMRAIPTYERQAR